MDLQKFYALAQSLINFELIVRHHLFFHNLAILFYLLERYLGGHEATIVNNEELLFCQSLVHHRVGELIHVARQA